MDPYDIFAGPILRRAEPTAVAIWLATTKKFDLVFRIRPVGSPAWTGRSTRLDTIKVFPGLFVHLAIVTPDKEPFPTGRMLEYSIGIVDQNGQEDHGPFRTIVMTEELFYRGFTLPTFYLQHPAAKLSALYASCRKIHDLKGGKRDALAFADGLIANNYNIPDVRPAVLCLTGDQIYADDVAHPTYDEIIRLSTKLYSGTDDEALPGGLRLPAKGQRQRFVKDNAGFTSGAAGNHLITFAEYVAMYGLAWNKLNWQLTPFVEGVKEFIADLPAVRRILANTPTYMIFDDHDVTDDWNLSVAWRRKVHDKPLGRRIVGNALYAFWLFQAWGNDPAAHQRWLTLIKDMNASRSAQPDLAFDVFSKITDWEFATPTTPFIYFLDTRTQRDVRDGSRRNAKWTGDPGAPAYLKSVGSWKSTWDTINRLRSNQPSDYPTVLVAPAPVFGFEAIDRIQAAVSEVAGPYALDYEGWAANLRHLLTFLRMCANRDVVLLSGDVHYAYTSTIRFTTFDDEIQRFAISEFNLNPPARGTGPVPTYQPLYSSRFIQLTSSAAKNYSSRALAKLARETDRYPYLVRYDANGIPSLYKASLKNGEVTLIPPKPSQVPVVPVKLEDFKPSCSLYQRAADAYNSPFLLEHNVGLVSIERRTVEHSLLASGRVVSFRKWDFGNDMYWQPPPG